jgi:valyl-tRNA synthetase
MEKIYNPKSVEDRIYKFWESGNFFASKPNPEKEKFVVMMPPPNVTGRLHTGHALNFTLQDVFVRFNRMLGKETLWLPGMDHAGIATQSVVERELLKKDIKREELGREKFLENVWEWKEEYGNTIVNQLKKLGTSADWSRLRFTLDDGYVKAVKEAFVKYYKEGLLYKGERIINWCPHCHTAISDIEVDYMPTKSKLYYIKYPFKDDSSRYVVVATTRPETMLGDTAVAVHPDDVRYKDDIGKILILPIVGREIPIVADEAVDMEFGTGAVKVTPAHSADDFEIAKRHNLPFVTVIDDRAKMVNVPKKYEGFTTEECRKEIVKNLNDSGYLVKEEDYENSVGHCSRCGTVVEPLVSEQWFLKMKDLADEAIEAVKNGDIHITPKKWEKVYYDWLTNIRDWCVSRQLWWGHRIPVYYCKDCGETIVSTEEVKKCPKCGSTNVVQDDDVLDTWFSSALWPFATLGWPDQTEDLKYYYPTSLLVTGYDILFFWVARMVMSGLHFMNEKPFDTVMLHGLVRDEKGRKMSKSLKNIIDPVDVINEFGTDALRFTLSYLSTVGGQDINLSKEKLTASRNFVNKMWNASRFVIINLDGFDPLNFDSAEIQYELEDKWFFSRLNKMVKREKELLSNYDLGEASRELYDFVWKEFCDWYIEFSKIRLYGNDVRKKEEVQYLLWDALNKILRMLHPFIPFVTEEIFSFLPHKERALIIAPFPEENGNLFNDEAEEDAEYVFSIIRAIRSVKSDFKIPIVKELSVSFNTKNKKEKTLLTEERDKIKKLAFVSSMEITNKKPLNTIKSVVGETAIYIHIAEGVDIEKEKERLSKKSKELAAEIEKIRSRLQNERYLSKAPKKVIEKDRNSLEEFEKEREIVIGHLKDLDV